MADFVGGATAAQDAIDILNINPHDMIDWFYEYTGKVASGHVLTPHTIETDDKYSERRKFSCYVNNYAPAIDSMVRPVFDAEVERSTNSAIVEAFWEDVDGRGTDIKAFMHDSATEFRKHTTYFLIIDNYTEEEQPLTEAEAIDARVIPYVYCKKPQDVYTYTLDRRGNPESITFLNGMHKADGKEYQVYLKIDNQSFVSYYEKTDDKGNKSQVILSDRLHSLGVIPVKAMTNKIAKGGLLCAPPDTYGMMRISATLFNKDSEMRESERKQMFSMMAIENAPDATPASISVGTSNVIFYASGAKTPAFVSPDASLLLALAETRQALLNDFLMVSKQSGVTGVQVAKSGAALAYEFLAKESVLHETANICESIEYWLIKMLGKWTNQTLDASIDYPDSFTPADDVMLMKWADMALMNRDALPASVVAKAAMLIARKIDPTMEADDEDELSEEIRSEMDGEKKTAEELAQTEEVAE